MAGNDDKLPKLTAQKFFVDVPLYEAIERDAHYGLYEEAILGNGTIDAYCVGCRAASVFRIAGPDRNERNRYAAQAQAGISNAFPTGYVSRELRCQRDLHHVMIFLFLVTDKVLKKVGQNPSAADLQKPELQKYRPILGDDRFRELIRAVGLAAHGVGIGAFVYLRRIFEALVEEAHVDARTNADWDEKAYVDGRVPDRIKMLGTRLPTFLADNAQLYGIMSKGVHDLTEDECLQHYDAAFYGM